MRISDWSSDVCSSDLPLCVPKSMIGNQTTTFTSIFDRRVNLVEHLFIPKNQRQLRWRNELERRAHVLQQRPGIFHYSDYREVITIIVAPHLNGSNVPSVTETTTKK